MIIMAYAVTFLSLLALGSLAGWLWWRSGEELPIQDHRATDEDLARIAGVQLDGPVARRWR